MPNKMLIDASHPEETRVVVLRGNRVEEFDFESVSKKQLRGNIYLAKVTRVEPSLQAAFVDYGGNRHGFLAFSEIHPDYYQIPVVDRQALLEDEARAQRDEDEEEQRAPRRSRRFRQGDRNGRRAEKRQIEDQVVSDRLEGAEATAEGDTHEGVESTVPSDLEERSPEESLEARVPETGEDAGPGEDHSLAASETSDEDASPDGPLPGPHESLVGDEPSFEAAAFETVETRGSAFVDSLSETDEASIVASEPQARQDNAEHLVGEGADEGDDENGDTGEVEQLGGDALEEVPVHHQPRYRRQYKIQEVIKRRQVLLVQVVKEERGNKGAALTTYLSLAGRYSVLMPNTARGGGISRKITDSVDRQRLKSIARELEVPDGMGVILRTAGAARTKAEVKRDFEYLLRMWETVRETTLQSTAPTLVYEEGSLIKRAIRDLYNKDIDEVVVAGEEAYREAKEFMRLLMPSHAKNVQPYRDPQPLFAKFGAETQLDAMFSNQVTLKSGGYIVINQTEALVAIDVNSGRSTREHNIEDTALRTNLEAVDEIARQLRLRDLAGLIVLDLIDMEESRNNRAVERRLKEALRNDRARIQVGSISHFGLLEMSRQRIRSGVLEGSTVPCPHCAGAGMVRSTASVSLHVLRVLEDAMIRNATYDLTVKTQTDVALYMLNHKRANLQDLERRFGVSVTIAADDSLTGSPYYVLERGELATGRAEAFIHVPQIQPPRAGFAPNGGADEEGNFERVSGIEADMLADHELAEAMPPEQTDRREANGDAEGRSRRRRRRRRGRGGDRESSGISATAPQPPDDALAAIAEITVRQGPAPEEELVIAEAEPQIEEAPVAEPVQEEAEAPVSPDRRRSRRRRTARGAPTLPLEEGEPGGESERSPEGAPDLVFEPEPAAALAEPEPPTEVAPAPRARRTRGTTRTRTAKSRGTPREPEPEIASGAELGTAETLGESSERVPETAGSSTEPPLTAIEMPPEPTAAAAISGDAPPEPPAPRGDEEQLPERPKRSGWWQRAKASQRS